MCSLDDWRSQPGSATTAAGIDHVRLSYDYLDAGDMDAYGSLLDEHMRLFRPDAPHGHGRTEVLRVHAGVAGPPARHRIHKIVAEGDSVVALGRLTGAPCLPGALAEDGVDFADFFTLSEEAMLLGMRRFYFAAPPPR